MPNFKKYSYDQTAMVVVNFKEQLRPNTFEFTLHYLIENHIDLSAFYDHYHNETGGRAARETTWDIHSIRPSTSIMKH